MKRKEILGILSLTGSAFIYAFFGILTRLAGFELPLFFSSWVRSLVSIAILAVPIILIRSWRPVRQRDIPWFLLRTLGGEISFFGSYFPFYFLPIGTAYFIFYAGTTLGGYLLGRVLFSEQLTRAKIISLFLALVGLGMIYANSFGAGNVLYMGVSFGGGIGFAIWNTFSKKISGIYSDIQVNFIDFFVNFVVMFCISLIVRETWVMPVISTVWIANLLFVAMFISTGQLMVYGFRHFDAQVGSLLMLSEVLFAIVLAFLFYKEIPSPFAFVGGIFILAAIIIPEIHSRVLQRRIL